MRVIGYDPYVSADTMRAGGIEKIDDLRALLAASDIVSIHAVLNDETRHLIGGLELGLMKPSAFLINVSRGAIVDEAALVVALTREGDRRRGARRVQPGADARRASDGRALRDGQRDPVSAPDLLHRGSDARG